MQAIATDGVVLVTTHKHDPCKNSWPACVLVEDVKSCAPKEPHARWQPRSLTGRDTLGDRVLNTPWVKDSSGLCTHQTQ